MFSDRNNIQLPLTEPNLISHVQRDAMRPYTTPVIHR